MNIIVFDTETTGLVDADLIELACVYRKDVDTGKECEQVSNVTFRMKPSSKILPASTVVHGITPDIASEFEDPAIVLKQVLSFFREFSKPTVFVAHNILYDNDIMNSAFMKYENIGFDPKMSIDTLRFAKKMIPQDEIGGYKLDAVFYYLFPKSLSWLFKNRSEHDALTDCKITYKILMELKSALNAKMDKEMTWEDVIDYVNAPIDMSNDLWAFGKHKGVLIKDTPSGYVNWCLSSEFGSDPKNADIVYSLKKARD